VAVVYKANQRNLVNASLAALAFVTIMLMMPYFGATTQEIKTYGQITPPSQLQEQQQGGGGQAITINGAGATFPFPLIDTWRVEYQSVNPSVSINYQSIGSGGGVRQFTERTVDFGASDAPLTEEEMQALSSSSTPVHIPETIGSVVAAYNIPGIDKGVKLTGPVLADIFAGKITRWDDTRIKELNPELPLPSADIVVVHRSDGSGTSFIWTSYLSRVSPEWNQTVGAGKSVQWTVGLGAQGNEGVSNTILSTPNSIGYVELTYALTTDMDYASLMNRAGNFVEPTVNSTLAAVQAAIIMNGTSGSTPNSTSGSAISLPGGDQSWTHVSLLDAPGTDSYPIASFSYLLLYKEMSTNINSMEKAQALAQFVNWAITDGQQFASPLHYVPLPESVVQHNQQTLRSLTFNGQPVLQ
jgi:phosphate transport system substrate-binding protein